MSIRDGKSVFVSRIRKNGIVNRQCVHKIYHTKRLLLHYYVILI